MRAILKESGFERWLDPSVKDAADVAGMIDGAQGGFEHHPVSTRLNAAKNDDETLLEPLA
jgi:putative SOS response-associated peptidase YedK